MFLHNHDTEAGQTLVLHVNRAEAVELVKALSGALSSSPDDENFSVTLGFTDHQHKDTENHVHDENCAEYTGPEPDAAV